MGCSDVFVEDLRFGAAAVVSSAHLMRAFMDPGLPHQQFACGAADWGKA
jgi:hypothetical protein